MIAFLSRIIADFLCRKNAIPDDNKEICAYGYEVLFFNLLNTGNIFLRYITEEIDLFYCLLFDICRSATILWWISCKKHHSLYIYLYNIIFIVLLAGFDAISEIYTFSVCIILNIAFLGMIVLYAPIENPNKTLDKFEKLKYRKISAYISIFFDYKHYCLLY